MTPEEWKEFQEWKEFRRQMEGAAPATPLGPTIAELQAPYALAKSSKGKEGIKSWHSCQRIHWNHLLPFWGHLTVPECTLEKADEYQRLRLSQPRLAPGKDGVPVKTGHMTAPATINLEMNSLRAMLNWSLKRHKIKGNPLSGHPDLEDDDPNRDRKFPIPYEHFIKILAELPQVTRLMMILGFETGMRRDEMRLLEWSEVRLGTEPKTIFLSKYRTKAKRERTIVLSDTAVAVIEAAPRMVSSRYVFTNPNKSDGSPLSKGTIGSQWRAAREAAKVCGPKGQPYWIHSIRKSYGTNKAMQGMPIYMLMEQMGHSDKNVHDEYTKMSPEHLGAVTEYQNKPAPRMGPHQALPSAETERPTLDPLAKLILK